MVTNSINEPSEQERSNGSDAVQAIAKCKRCNKRIDLCTCTTSK